MTNKEKIYQDDHDSLVLTEEEQEVKEPSMYQVYLVNDDYTPMDFVIWLLQVVFFKNMEEATKLMLEVHHKGRGICGIFPYDVAHTKVTQVRQLAKKHEHPLECEMEALD